MKKRITQPFMNIKNNYFLRTNKNAKDNHQ